MRPPTPIPYRNRYRELQPTQTAQAAFVRFALTLDTGDLAVQRRTNSLLELLRAAPGDDGLAPKEIPYRLDAEISIALRYSSRFSCRSVMSFVTPSAWPSVG